MPEGYASFSISARGGVASLSSAAASTLMDGRASDVNDRVGVAVAGGRAACDAAAHWRHLNIAANRPHTTLGSCDTAHVTRVAGDYERPSPLLRYATRFRLQKLHCTDVTFRAPSSTDNADSSPIACSKNRSRCQFANFRFLDGSWLWDRHRIQEVSD